MCIRDRHRAALEDTVQLRQRADQDFDLQAELTLELLLDSTRELARVLDAAAKQHVAALQQRTHVLETESGIRRAQRLHLDLAGAADVDGTEHRYEDRHCVSCVTHSRVATVRAFTPARQLSALSVLE